MPVTYTFPSTTNTLLTATVPGKTSTGSCKDYTWLDVPNWATRIIFLAEWAGPNINTRDPVSNGWDCKHSAMTYGIYRKSNTTNTYALVAQSQAYGVFDEAKKQCNHPFSVPQSEVPKPVGTQLIDYNTSPTKYRYRIAVQAWQHNDPDLAHLTQACGTALNCYWPTKVSMASIP
ncbi:MAG: hypothetical protein SFV15_15680 [Polyangiaceae bacterium]|nr:hypothetical protein [Polyangiaceae bacterium]